ncbi:hypothetical protein, partial [Neisseria meningitidis]|uniref:hypothetical protein n=1 Tax=Neisseria meningitidis TaxID=487 RepID=UPI001C9A0EDD
MIAISLLPGGVIQAYASITHGLWDARSGEVLQMENLDTLRWGRTAADLIFLGGGDFGAPPTTTNLIWRGPKSFWGAK